MYCILFQFYTSAPDPDQWVVLFVGPSKHSFGPSLIVSTMYSPISRIMRVPRMRWRPCGHECECRAQSSWFSSSPLCLRVKNPS